MGKHSERVIAPLAGVFDSHSHVNAPEFDADREAVLARMREAGMAGAVVVACDRPEAAPMIALVERYRGFLAGAWALHPEYEDRPEVTLEEILQICAHPAVCAVGETGLDYHWCRGDLSWQRARFARHIEAAQRLDKPLIIHAREAESDALDILERHEAARTGFVLHCFGGSAEDARRCVLLGGLISVTGVVTFKNADNLRDIVREIPLEALMIETDCPYMAPVPMRGRRCEPTYVAAVAQEIARVKGLAPETVAQATTQNALRFFRLTAFTQH
ncbi:MAG: TatD family hydrolase [Duodenibacillus sp.]